MCNGKGLPIRTAIHSPGCLRATPMRASRGWTAGDLGRGSASWSTRSVGGLDTGPGQVSCPKNTKSAPLPARGRGAECEDVSLVVATKGAGGRLVQATGGLEPTVGLEPPDGLLHVRGVAVLSANVPGSVKTEKIPGPAYGRALRSQRLFALPPPGSQMCSCRLAQLSRNGLVDLTVGL